MINTVTANDIKTRGVNALKEAMADKNELFILKVIIKEQ